MGDKEKLLARLVQLHNEREAALELARNKEDAAADLWAAYIEDNEGGKYLGETVIVHQDGLLYQITLDFEDVPLVKRFHEYSRFFDLEEN